MDGLRAESLYETDSVIIYEAKLTNASWVVAALEEAGFHPHQVNDVNPAAQYFTGYNQTVAIAVPEEEAAAAQALLVERAKESAARVSAIGGRLWWLLVLPFGVGMGTLLLVAILTGRMDGGTFAIAYQVAILSVLVVAWVAWSRKRARERARQAEAPEC